MFLIACHVTDTLPNLVKARRVALALELHKITLFHTVDCSIFAMPIVLYYLKPSPPVRSVLLTARAVGVELELKTVNLLEKEHLTPEYRKINPMHTVPTLDDNGFIVIDSHAINAYLVNKYAKTDALYPKEPRARSVVDQRLHFDSGILFPRLRGIVAPILFQGATSIPDAGRDLVLEAYDWLDSFIGDNQWVAGNEITIADFNCASTVSSVAGILPGIDDRKNVAGWLKRCEKEISGYKELNQEGADMLISMVKAKLG